MMQMIKKGLILVISSVLVLPYATDMSVAHAQVPYQTEVVSVTNGGTLEIAPGEVANVELALKNTGSSAWVNDGSGYISLYTFDPKYRRSSFDPGTWLWWNQVKRINEKTVAPGATATLAFELRAPKEEGTYTEAFHLASEDRAWVTGGEIALTIHVKDGAIANTEPVVDSVPVVSQAPSADVVASSAKIIAQTITDIAIKAGAVVNVQVAVQNTGSQAWNGFGVLPPAARIATVSPSFADTSWGTTQVAYASQRILPGETGTLSFNLRAPQQNGRHTAKLEIMTDEGRRTGEYVEVSMDVTEGSGELLNAPVDEDVASYVEEPVLRIGTLIVDEEVNHEVYIRSNTSTLRLENLEGALLEEIPMETMVWMAYQDGIYKYRIANEVKTSATALRLVPPASTDILEVVNFDRRLTRGAAFADNAFRGILELRYNESKDRVWLVNEIPMELYLRGLAETSDSSPHEYQKAMITAARTFALYHRTHETKWRKEHFTITAYSYDQVYRGYGQEKRSPNIVKAVEETKGEVIVYGGEVIPTPYFSRSNGRTRNWSDVWNGSVPWAVSVSVPCEQGKTLLGHGVGMSAQGAMCFARDGMTGEQILKHFYTGVEIEKRWR